MQFPTIEASGRRPCPDQDRSQFADVHPVRRTVTKPILLGEDKSDMPILRWASAISRHSAPPVTRPAVTVEPACLRIVAPLAIVFGSRAEPGSAVILSRN